MFGILVSIENIFDGLTLNLLTYIIIRIWIKIHLQKKILMCLLTSYTYKYYLRLNKNVIVRY